MEITVAVMQITSGIVKKMLQSLAQCFLRKVRIFSSKKFFQQFFQHYLFKRTVNLSPFHVAPAGLLQPVNGSNLNVAFYQVVVHLCYGWCLLNTYFSTH